MTDTPHTPQGWGTQIPPQRRPGYGQSAYGQSAYGQSAYGQPAYGAPGTPAYGQQPVGPGVRPAWAEQPWGAPRPKRSGLPWLIGGLVAMLVAGGIGLVILLQDDSPAVVAEPPAQSDPAGAGSPVPDPDPSPDPDPVPAPPTDCLVECPETDAPTGDLPAAEDANHAGSGDTARDFVQAIADGDQAGAHAALCGAGHDMFATPSELVADFYETFGFTAITGGSLVDLYAADTTHDAAVFELETDTGVIDIEVYVIEEGSSLAICGYDVP